MEFPRQHRIYILLLAVLFLLGSLATPVGLPEPAWHMLLVAMAAGLLWMSELLPMGITSLVVIFILSVLDILPLREGLALIFHPVSAIVFAGFCLAASLQKYGLDRRLSLSLILRMGKGASRTVLGMMVATALLSMIISNSASTAIMVAMAMGLLKTAGAVPGQSQLGRVLLLGIPFAANIGGMGTPVGTPGNAITLALLSDLAGIELSFLAWMAYALPIVALLVPLAWRVLLMVYPPEERGLDLEQCRQELQKLGPMGPGEKKVAVIVLFITLLWAGEPFLAQVPDWTAMVALLAVIILATPGLGVLTWKEIHQHTGWHIFLLVGGGLALGTGLVKTGAVSLVVGQVTPYLTRLPYTLVLGMVSLLTATAILFFCTISGTATTFVPLALGLALAMDWPPALFALAAGLSSSFAFLLPANSAPNALAYGAGYFRPVEMFKAGALLMAVGVAVIVLTAALWWPVLHAIL